MPRSRPVRACRLRRVSVLAAPPRGEAVGEIAARLPLPARPLLPARRALPVGLTHPARRVLPVGLALLALTGCGSLASGPGWVGGGLAVAAPAREAEEEAREAREREIVARQPKQVGAKHILVMHKESKSRPESVTRTRDEAKARAQACLLKIRGGGDFDAVVKECSDEPGAAERAGDLGVFERGQMVKGFADAAFALRVGEISEIVETPFGFHIIRRTE